MQEPAAIMIWSKIKFEHTEIDVAIGRDRRFGARRSFAEKELPG